MGRVEILEVIVQIHTRGCMKTLILGSNGYIANRLKTDIIADFSTRKIFSIKDAQEVIDEYYPDVIINCIGYTGTNVEDCDIDSDKTMMCNTIVPLILAEACLRNNVKLVHISSGCIYRFDYAIDPAIVETQVPDFLSLYYSRTKIYSERALEALLYENPFLIIRFRLPLDNISHPKNLLNKLVKYRRVIDVPNSVTYVPDLVAAIKHLIDTDAKGIFNVVNRGVLRYPELLKVYQKYVPDFDYEVIQYKELHMVRPNLIMSCKKLEKAGYLMREIHDVLDEAVQGTISR